VVGEAFVEPAVHFSTFPRTQAPLHFVPDIISVFRAHGTAIATTTLSKGLSSDAVMATLRDDLCKLGFEIEAGKAAAAKLKRPVFFGQDGKPSRQYEIDGFHPDRRCGIEVEADCESWWQHEGAPLNLLARPGTPPARKQNIIP
jgi:hypothetical protein